ncbi:spore photoproduct lyase [Clostridium estertheticum]|uniref:Spore photoproduct lyase n=1 Tax=Clostridium estertheticum subsp. estertheticum TaxID=1552 RepID=A0A1J0GIB2_9CLOT|nr:spore photoproduct lyase [Clostridium estertheticum]APC40704.1 spore photoproduct lyase [Clostridium estertheticum subsp. estertheticum]MBU3074325.1 spore photoproduct lyase [Clostridium estertheticum]MBU3164419.1 spore photoproduct lyase [Clostridium estertheticum]MBZ9617464.1 spore photoproduct lyase [Clostridium estertheticum subsp. laramiense]WAG73144.1 spore photoproduct lyase [Clostridium estertheticum]
MKLFIPDIAYMDPKLLKYEESKGTIKYLEELKVPIVNSKKVVIDSGSPERNYAAAKKTVLFTTNGQKKLMSCKPSADYQFSLSSSCPANCEYCYLQTTQGEKPFMKIFLNIEEILENIQTYIDANLPSITSFECASITDPIALEHLSGNLKKCIEFFGRSEKGRLRLVTKFDDVDPFLKLKHNKHTKFRFTLNTPYVIDNFEHNTSTFKERIGAVKKIASAGYPIGFIIAPIMIYDNWRSEYKELFKTLKIALADYKEEVSFELIQHRFTKAAKELIVQRFKNTKLDLDEEKRLLKWGPYGKFKYVYKKPDSEDIKNYISEQININFDLAIIEYFT